MSNKEKEEKFGYNNDPLIVIRHHHYRFTLYLEFVCINMEM